MMKIMTIALAVFLTANFVDAQAPIVFRNLDSKQVQSFGGIVDAKKFFSLQQNLKEGDRLYGSVRTGFGDYYLIAARVQNLTWSMRYDLSQNLFLLSINDDSLRVVVERYFKPDGTVVKTGAWESEIIEGEMFVDILSKIFRLRME